MQRCLKMLGFLFPFGTFWNSFFLEQMIKIQKDPGKPWTGGNPTMIPLDRQTPDRLTSFAHLLYFAKLLLQSCIVHVCKHSCLLMLASFGVAQLRLEIAVVLCRMQKISQLAQQWMLNFPTHSATLAYLYRCLSSDSQPSCCVVPLLCNNILESCCINIVLISCPM